MYILLLSLILLQRKINSENEFENQDSNKSDTDTEPV